MTAITDMTAEQWLSAQPAEVWDFEREALKGIVLVRLYELPELSTAPREFTHGWLPMAVEAAVHRFADAVTEQEPNKHACVRRFGFEQFVTEGYAEQVAISARIWADAQR
ncbi:Uncharacterised protein [Mycobacteroides abscessus subsp. abscessus]|uniref:hypothetical protein n=1 Tax=Mycobacteroides abscessus TaxID=36809 RepID=UPI000925FF50|nr:hypothetical protein [Mycobacteroides abscessus]SIC64796.1 Uncharacterised protein [Mycobacteroides abscessus subsp. abscessus]SIG65760.1 Uncharacterised protein [Mycobacteroides abscessus subsp. abscessus]